MEWMQSELGSLVARLERLQTVDLVGDIDFTTFRTEDLTFDHLHFGLDGRGGFTIETDLYHGPRESDPNYLTIQSLLDFYRRLKEKRYRKHLASGYSGLKCLAEGDSWFELPPFVYATDIVRELWDDYAILSLAKAGDTWEQILKGDDLLATVAEEQPDVVLLSAGGNNFLGRVPDFVLPWSADRPIDAYLNDEADYEMNKITFYYEWMLTRLVGLGCDVIIHGYGYGDPRAGHEGGFLIGGPLSRHRNINDKRIWRTIITQIVDELNVRLARIAAMDKFGGRVRYIDLRPLLGTGQEWWQDEPHLTKKGYRVVANAFRKELEGIAADRQKAVA